MPDLQQASLGQLIEATSPGRDFILLGDTSHAESSLQMAVLDPQTIASMQRAGVKHLCLEVSRDAQFYVDDYYSGKLSFEQLQEVFSNYQRTYFSPEENAQGAKAYPEMIRAAKDAGIKVHFVDKGDADFVGQPPATPEEKRMGEIWNKQEQLQASDPAQIRVYMQGLEDQEPGINARFQAYAANLIASRLRFDHKIASEMETMAKDGKVVIFYGDTHIANGPALMPELGDRGIYIALRAPEDKSPEDPRRFTPEYTFYPGAGVDGPPLALPGAQAAPQAVAPVPLCADMQTAIAGFASVMDGVGADNSWKAPNAATGISGQQQVNAL